MADDVKYSRFKTTTELVEREKELRAICAKIKVPFKELYSEAMIKAAEKAMDSIEINQMYGAGHQLSAEREKMRLKRESAAHKAKESKEHNKPTYHDAQSDHRSIHSLYSLPDPLPESIELYNRKVQRLSVMLNQIDKSICKRRRLKDNVVDLVIEAGWTHLYVTLADTVFEQSPTPPANTATENFRLQES